jgi:predicted dithiol-disulfide oxidoreductase (DUF899 family)
VSREEWLATQKAFFLREKSLTHGSDHVCKGCSLVADHIDAARRHFADADLAFAAISRAPSDFNYDFGVSFRKEDLAAGRVTFNHGTIPIKRSEDMMGASMLAQNDNGEILRTYSTYSRGIENLMGAFMWEDLAHGGRHQFDDGGSRLTDDGLRDVRREPAWTSAGA